jgi:hypothetical protein
VKRGLAHGKQKAQVVGGGGQSIDFSGRRNQKYNMHGSGTHVPRVSKQVPLTALPARRAGVSSFFSVVFATIFFFSTSFFFLFFFWLGFFGDDGSGLSIF